MLEMLKIFPPSADDEQKITEHWNRLRDQFRVSLNRKEMTLENHQPNSIPDIAIIGEVDTLFEFNNHSNFFEVFYILSRAETHQHLESKKFLLASLLNHDLAFSNWYTYGPESSLELAYEYLFKLMKDIMDWDIDKNSTKKLFSEEDLDTDNKPEMIYKSFYVPDHRGYCSYYVFNLKQLKHELSVEMLTK